METPPRFGEPLHPRAIQRFGEAGADYKTTRDVGTLLYPRIFKVQRCVSAFLNERLEFASSERLGQDCGALIFEDGVGFLTVKVSVCVAFPLKSVIQEDETLWSARASAVLNRFQTQRVVGYVVGIHVDSGHQNGNDVLLEVQANVVPW